MLTREEVLRIAHLARLKIEDSEIEEYRVRLGRVLDYMKELEKLPVEQPEFLRHIPKDAVAFRKDIAFEWPGRDGLLANAPSAEQSQFLLPVVVDRDTE
jgi:aspartyl-tRNA(Asn)/glutamyl-tRNA(Gln) amidotransferase subunit C